MILQKIRPIPGCSVSVPPGVLGAGSKDFPRFGKDLLDGRDPVVTALVETVVSFVDAPRPSACFVGGGGHQVDGGGMEVRTAAAGVHRVSTR